MGTANVVVQTGTSVTISAAATTFYGVDQTTPFGTVAKTGGTGNAITGVAVSSAAGEVVVDAVAIRDRSTLGAGAGQTALATRIGTGPETMHTGISTEAGAASVTMSWTAGGSGSGAGEWAIVVAPLKASLVGVPVISGLAGDTLRYTAGGGAIVIDQGGNASVTDSDSPDFAGGTLTVSLAAGSDAAEDVLAIRDQGTGAGQIGVSGANVSYGGAVIGTFSGGTGGSPLVVTFNANANAASATALVRNISFQDTDGASPTLGTRTVRFVLTDGDGSTSANVDTSVTLGAATPPASLWLSSATVATSSAGSGGLSWNDGQVVNFGDPNLALGSGTTAGTFSSVFDIDSFAADGNANLAGLHRVSRSVTVGAGGGATTLLAGDILFAVTANETFGGVAVSKNDIVLFRPTTPGNFSAGTFSILLQNPTAKQVGDFTLVEQSTVVGGQTLQAGSFLISEPSKVDLDLFVATATGAGTTAGTLTQKFVDGAGFNLNAGIEGVELIGSAVTIGGVSLSAGQLLFTLNANDSTVGSNNLSATKYDIITVTLSSVGSGTTAGTAAMLFTGADVGISAGGEEFDALALVGINQAPALSGANALTTILEDPASNPGTLVSALISGRVTDGDSGALTGIAVTAVDNTNGSWQWSANGGVTWNAFGSPSGASARLLIADTNTYVRFVPNANWNGTVGSGLTFRAWDQTSGTAGLTADTTTNGGSSAFSSATASASITVSAVNDAPTITNAATVTLTGTDENTTSSGTTVNTILTGASWADVDSGALKGIAVTSKTRQRHLAILHRWRDLGRVRGGVGHQRPAADFRLRRCATSPTAPTARPPSFSFVAWDQTTRHRVDQRHAGVCQPGRGRRQHGRTRARARPRR